MFCIFLHLKYLHHSSGCFYLMLFPQHSTAEFMVSSEKSAFVTWHEIAHRTFWKTPQVGITQIWVCRPRGQSKTSKEQSEKSSCTRIHLHMPKKMSLNRTSATFKLANFFFFPGVIPVSFWSPITPLHTLVLAAVILQLHHLLRPDRIFTSS